MLIAFVMNPTSWNNETGAPWPGGMADRLVQPVLEHLDPSEYRVVRMPLEGDVVNVYYTHRGVQGVKDEPGARSVFVSHGIADKNWRNADRMGARFDFVFVSGPAWTLKLVNGGQDPATICEVGYAKLDPLVTAERLPRRDARIRVLWAPTHGGGGEHEKREGGAPRRRVSSHWSRQQLLDLLPAERFDVREAPHPRHRPDKRATFDEYLDCDVVVADGGSTIYEAWALGLPVVFPTWLTGTANQLRARRRHTFESELYERRIGYHALRPDAFAAQVERAARNGLTIDEADFVDPILPASTLGSAGRLHAEELRAIAAGGRPARVAAPLRKIRYRSKFRTEIEVIPGSLEHQRFEASSRWERVESVEPAVQREVMPV